MIDMLVAEFSLEEALRVVVAKGQLIATALLALPIKPLSLNQLLYKPSRCRDVFAAPLWGCDSASEDKRAARG